MRWHPLNGYNMSLPAALPWRTDISEVARTAGHDHGRVTSSGWVYCRSHRTWEPLERRVWPDTAGRVEPLRGPIGHDPDKVTVTAQSVTVTAHSEPT